MNSSTDSDSNILTITTVSNRQLRPHLPISYNETLLKRLHSHLQVRAPTNIAIFLPKDIDKDTSEDNTKSISNLSKNSSKSDGDSDLALKE